MTTILELICMLKEGFSEKENGTSDSKNQMYRQVGLSIPNFEQFLKELKFLAELNLEK